MGGATGLVGDPSGRVKERDALPREALERNVSGITENLTRIFENEEQLHHRAGCPKLKLVHSHMWPTLVQYFIGAFCCDPMYTQNTKQLGLVGRCQRGGLCLGDCPTL